MKKVIGTGLETIAATTRVSEAIKETATMGVYNALVAVVGEKYSEAVKTMLNSVAKLDLPDLTMEKIKQYGFPLQTARKVFAVVQFSLCVNKADSKGTVIRSPEDAAKLLMHLQFEKQEHFVVMGLNVKNEVLFNETVFVGSLYACTVSPLEIMRLLTSRSGVAQFIVGHQHPSGNPMPSTDDLDITMRLHEAGKIMGIDLVDHIVVGDNTFISMKEKGYF